MYSQKEGEKKRETGQSFDVEFHIASSWGVFFSSRRSLPIRRWEGLPSGPSFSRLSSLVLSHYRLSTMFQNKTWLVVPLVLLSLSLSDSLSLKPAYSSLYSCSSFLFFFISTLCPGNGDLGSSFFVVSLLDFVLFFRLGTGVEHRTPPPLMSCNFTPFSCCFQLFYLVPSSDNTSRHDVISNAGPFFINSGNQ